MHIGFLRDLLEITEAYEAAGGNTTVLDREEFAAWLIAHQRQAVEKGEKPSLFDGPPINGLIAMYLGFMAKYAQFYSRRVFRHSVIYSEDDWGVLITLYPFKQMKKTAVMRACILEKSSGNEVLKRMLKQGLLREKANPEDGRSKLVELTDAGRTAFDAVQTGILNLSNTVVADLTEEEKQTLLQILAKLHRFHKPMFEEADEKEVEAMLGTGA